MLLLIYPQMLYLIFKTSCIKPIEVCLNVMRGVVEFSFQRIQVGAAAIHTHIRQGFFFQSLAYLYEIYSCWFTPTNRSAGTNMQLSTGRSTESY